MCRTVVVLNSAGMSAAAADSVGGIVHHGGMELTLLVVDLIVLNSLPEGSSSNRGVSRMCTVLTVARCCWLFSSAWQHSNASQSV